MSEHFCPYCRESYWDLGWHNDEKNRPAIEAMLKHCKAKGHKRKEFDASQGFRGLEHVVGCSDCRYVYRYDSSG